MKYRAVGIYTVFWVMSGKALFFSFPTKNKLKWDLSAISQFPGLPVWCVSHTFIQWVYNMLKGINHFPLQPIWSDAIFLPELHCRGFLPTIRLHHFLQWQSSLTISRMICRSHKQTRLAIRINSVVKYSLSHLWRRYHS